MTSAKDTDAVASLSSIIILIRRKGKFNEIVPLQAHFVELMQISKVLVTLAQRNFEQYQNSEFQFDSRKLSSYLAFLHQEIGCRLTIVSKQVHFMCQKGALQHYNFLSVIL